MTRLLFFGFFAAFVLLALQITVATKAEWVVAYYLWIFWTNILIIFILAITTLAKIWSLFREVRRQQYGSRLALKLFSVLSLASIVPSLVVYGISYRFLDSTIDSWFKLEIDQTVSGGINLAKWVTDEEAKKLERSANTLALTLGEETIEEQKKQISKWREVLAVESITLFDEDRNIIAHNHKNLISLSAKLPDALILKDISFRAVAHLLNVEEITNNNQSEKNGKSNIPIQEIRVLARLPISNRVINKPENKLSHFENSLSPKLSSPSGFGFNNPANNIPIITSRNISGENLGSALPKTIYMQIIQPVPERISEGLFNLNSAYVRYRELQQGRDGLKKLFLTSLSLLFALALISALAIAFYFSNRFIQPLGVLTEGTRAVARGDFSRKLREGGGSHDEFDQLIMSFNDMTDELKLAQNNAEDSRKAMETSERFLQNVLDHINAGVLIVEVTENQQNKADENQNNNLKVAMINNSGLRLMGKDFELEFAQALYLWQNLRPFAQAISENINKLINKMPTFDRTQNLEQNTTQDIIDNEWGQQVDLHLGNGFRTFMLRGVKIPKDQRWVVVFDDITDLLRTKHMQVWSELARRLAHEIKNPLTPIQLSAERLLLKLNEKIPEADRGFFERSIGTIVSQVDAIKTLVNQFREMARPASTLLEVFSINDLLAEVSALYDEKRIKVTLPRKKYWINADRHQLRQAFHNVIINAEQANFDKFQDWDKSRVQITLQNFKSNNDLTLFENNNVKNNLTSGVSIEILDIGGGFSAEIINRAFEPNVTSKIKGSGLGLSIVRKIIEEHRGSINISNCEWIAGEEGFEWDDINPHGTKVIGALITMMLPTVEKGR